ncbi:hypothetical protein D3C77_782400 [compost metagenome]
MAAFLDGLHDDFGRTAVQPVAISQVGKAGAALGVRAMALRAGVQEQALTDFTGARVL